MEWGYKINYLCVTIKKKESKITLQYNRRLIKELKTTLTKKSNMNKIESILPLPFTIQNKKVILSILYKI